MVDPSELWTLILCVFIVLLLGLFVLGELVRECVCAAKQRKTILIIALMSAALIAVMGAAQLAYELTPLGRFTPSPVNTFNRYLFQSGLMLYSILRLRSVARMIAKRDSA